MAHPSVAGWLLAAVAIPALAAGKWQVAYYYDKEKSSLVINDLQFPSAQHGVAAGYIDEGGRSRPAMLISDDGGVHWTVSHVKNVPVSLFFLNAQLGWMVTPEGLYQTSDGGRAWREIAKSPKLLMKVYFLDEQRGFAIGGHKSAYETVDGGKSWQPIAAAAEPKTDPQHTVYNEITFVNGKAGLMEGYSVPPRAGDEGKPDWLDAQGTVGRREWPHLSIMLDTRDGGHTWRPSTSSMFGHITRTMFLPDGRGLGLIEFTDTFKWPSEVHLLNGASGQSERVYNAADRAITDILLLPDGTGYLAGVEVQGRLQHSPIPSKVVVLESGNLTDWQEMPVDYRASGVRAMLRAAPDGGLWLATDTGMILKWSGK